MEPEEGGGAQKPVFNFLGLLLGQKSNLSREIYQQTVDKENENFLQQLRQQFGATREVTAAAIVAMATVSLAGNGFVCCVMHRRRSLRTVTNIFLLNLSIAQMLMACTSVPINLAKMFYIDWQLGGEVCSLAYFANSLCTGVSSFTLVCIAIDRHRVIVTPMRPRLSRSFVHRMLACCWLAAAAMAAASVAWPAAEESTGQPAAATGRRAEDPEGHARVYLTRRSPVCAFMAHERSQEVRLVFTCAAFALQYLLPLFVITGAYARIIHTLWIAKRSFGPGGQAGADSGVTGGRQVARRRTIVMLLLVVCLFFISWSPIHLFVISRSWRRVDRGDREVLLHGVCYWIGMSNIWYNPIIYAWLNVKFRRALRQILCPCWRPGGLEENPQPRRRREPAAPADVAAVATDVVGAAGTADATPRRQPQGRAGGGDFALSDTPETNPSHREEIGE